VIALYATFLNRAFDQLLMDVALHRQPVTVVLDRAGVTGTDGASHNGMSNSFPKISPDGRWIVWVQALTDNSPAPALPRPNHWCGRRPPTILAERSPRCASAIAPHHRPEDC